MTAALLAAALLTPDSPVLPASPERIWRDRDGDLWIEETDGHVSALSGVLAWAVPGAVAVRSHVEAEFGPLTEVRP